MQSRGPAVEEDEVIMMVRVQRGRQGENYFPTLDEYAHYFCLTEEVLAGAKSDVIILHPRPMNRGIEIASGVADGPSSVMMNQVDPQIVPVSTNGTITRQLSMLIPSDPALDVISNADQSAEIARPRAAASLSLVFHAVTKRAASSPQS